MDELEKQQIKRRIREEERLFLMLKIGCGGMFIGGIGMLTFGITGLLKLAIGV